MAAHRRRLRLHGCLRQRRLSRHVGIQERRQGAAALQLTGPQTAGVTMKKSMSTLALAAVVAAGTTLAAASTARAATNASPDCNIHNLGYYCDDNNRGYHTGISGRQVADVMNASVDL